MYTHHAQQLIDDSLNRVQAQRGAHWVRLEVLLKKERKRLDAKLGTVRAQLEQEKNEWSKEKRGSDAELGTMRAELDIVQEMVSGVCAIEDSADRIVNVGPVCAPYPDAHDF